MIWVDEKVYEIFSFFFFFLSCLSKIWTSSLRTSVWLCLTAVGLFKLALTVKKSDISVCSNVLDPRLLSPPRCGRHVTYFISVYVQQQQIHMCHLIIHVYICWVCVWSLNHLYLWIFDSSSVFFVLWLIFFFLKDLETSWWLLKVDYVIIKSYNLKENKKIIHQCV